MLVAKVQVSRQRANLILAGMAWVVVCDVGGQCYTPHEIDTITYDNSMLRRYSNSVGTNSDTGSNGTNAFNTYIN